MLGEVGELVLRAEPVEVARDLGEVKLDLDVARPALEAAAVDGLDERLAFRPMALMRTMSPRFTPVA